MTRTITQAVTSSLTGHTEDLDFVDGVTYHVEARGHGWLAHLEGEFVFDISTRGRLGFRLEGGSGFVIIPAADIGWVKAAQP